MTAILPLCALVVNLILLVLLGRGRRSPVRGLLVTVGVGLALGLAEALGPSAVPAGEVGKLAAVFLVSQVPGLLVLACWHLWPRSRVASVLMSLAGVASAVYFTPMLLVTICATSGDCL